MPKTISKGKCSFCKKIISKSTMTRHLQSCEKRNNSKKKNYFHIVVEGKYNPEYWMHLEVLDTSKLTTLDSFLRDIWLECCGHMSMFTIDKINYSNSADYFESEFNDKSTNVSINKVVSVGSKFTYDYDFGSTTSLSLKVVGITEIADRKKSITIIARNQAPKILCLCGKKAAIVCAQCIYDGEGWYCKTCSEDHECGEDMFLPVLNSPRTGICGYCGES